ncbi:MULTISPECIES: DUF1427 family protein [unclassified Sphingomonas]|uniref:DUF1427 family protein n=1 Tax=unclassified Sphingomonas TaxID=196159 RepID=UPI0006FA446F|nr:MULTISPECIES: DUF1427 family protein [unclassified Sphingomonas]KQX18726.1 XapX domain-containing protein [Sphingomonas sp. Root1294]KQY71950.1 XapX domain-containing protein [Sphingomonas sp. Root50]KRB94785.1 XapX domain-containing protein [Sphingomonas sp. Root720]
MKIYLLSMGAGLLAGLLYSLIGVRSPAPPAVALVGLLGILLGEQMLPVARRFVADPDILSVVRSHLAANDQDRDRDA